MVAATVRKSHPLWLERLDLPAYTVPEAERYAGLHRAEISEWFRARLEPGPSDSPECATISYLELVEVAFVASFRSMGVPMELIRFANDNLAPMVEAEHKLAVRLIRKHPFAALRFKKIGHGVLEELLRSAPSCVKRKGDFTPTDWPAVLESRFAEFDYHSDYGIAIRWRLAGPDSRVVIDPRVAFGDPMISGSGLATWVIKGSCEAGYTVQEISDEYQIDEIGVRDAIAFEESVPD